MNAAPAWAVYAQWAVVGLVVLASLVYSAKALMPRAWRARLAAWLRARGQPRLAATFDAGFGCGGGCGPAACAPGSALRKPRQ